MLWAVRWYCRYGVSYRDLEQMMGERGVSVDHSTDLSMGSEICSGDRETPAVAVASAEIDKLARRRNLYQGPRPMGLPLAGRRQIRRYDRVLPPPTRSAAAAKRFLGKALNGLKSWELPHVISTDKAQTYAAALVELKKEGKCPEDTVHGSVAAFRHERVQVEAMRWRSSDKRLRGGRINPSRVGSSPLR